MNNSAKIKCPRCDGDGIVGLSQELLSVLRMASATRGITSGRVRAKLDPNGHFQPTAFNNRLNDLVSYGFLRREKQGRNWSYYRIDKP